MKESQKEIVKRYFSDFYNASNVHEAQEIVDKILHDNFIDHSPIFGSEPNKQGFKRSIGIVQTAFCQDYTVETLLQHGNYYIAIWSGKITRNGTFLDFLPPTGNILNITGITIYEIINNKITQHWEQFDQLSMMTELGLIQKK